MRQEANYKEKEMVSVREGKNKHLNTESLEWKKSKWKKDKERSVSDY